MALEANFHLYHLRIWLWFHYQIHQIPLRLSEGYLVLAMISMTLKTAMVVIRLHLTILIHHLDLHFR